jgi:transposase InsO family protein
MRRLYHQRLEKKAFKMAIVLMIRDLPPQERSRKIDELTKQQFNIPYSGKKTLSRSVIYRWLKQYTESTDPVGVLMPKERSDRNTFRKLTEDQKKALLRWRYDNVYRTVCQLREELLAHVSTANQVPSESTIARFLKSVNLDRKTLLAKNTLPQKVRLAYEAPYPQYLWLADTKGPNLYVKDPDNPDKVRLAKLILFLDDHSRYVVAASYHFEENEIIIMQLFRQAIALYGVPNSLYVDRGSPYMGKSLKRAATILGCHIIHTPKRDASAKGKVEKGLRLFYEHLESELALHKPPLTIDQANEYLAAIIGQDYHRNVHSTTGQTPEERFFSFPAEYRRFVSKNALAMVFLPSARSRVSKTGLIHLNKLQYLVPSASLYGRWVEVRYDPQDRSRVHCWYEDQYYGEAHVYLTENDYLKRQELMEKLQEVPEITIPPVAEVPLYSYLERKLAEHRAQVEEADINNVLALVKAKKEHVKAALLKALPTALEAANDIGTSERSGSPTDSGNEFGADSFTHLLAVLLKRSLDAHDRLSIHTLWRAYGPFDEELVRKTIGQLLGDGHPVSDLAGYLEAVRIAVLSEK